MEIQKSQAKSWDFEISYAFLVCCKPLGHDIRQEPETTTVLCALIGTATVLKAGVASKVHVVGW